jgi:DNA-binding MarR family transcriptional regulator
VLEVFEQAEGPRTQEALRAELRVRTQRLQLALKELEMEGFLERTPGGWSPLKPNGDETPYR